MIRFVRHARPAVGGDVFIGGLDVPLAAGVAEDIVAARSRFSGGEGARIVSSPLVRAFKTAELLFPGLSIHVDERLKERGLGEWEGGDKAELRRLYPGAFLPTGRLRPDFTPPGGEPLERLCDRVAACVADIRLRSVPCVAVAHNGVIAAALHRVRGLSLADAFARPTPYLGAEIIGWSGEPHI